MDKRDKEILKDLVKREIEEIKKEEKDINLASLKFLKSIDKYEEKLKELLKKL